MSTYITKIKTKTGPKQIDYNALANKPDLTKMAQLGDDGLVLKSQLPEIVVDSSGATQEHNESVNAHSNLFAGKADLVNGKVPTSQLPSMSVDASGAIDNHNEDNNAHATLFAQKADLVDGKLKSDQLPDLEIDASAAINEHNLSGDAHASLFANYVSKSNLGVQNGVATLGEDGKVPSSQLPESNIDVTGAINKHDDNQKAHEELFAAKADLGTDGKVPLNQLPTMNYEASGAVNIHNSATDAHINLFANYVPNSNLGTKNGVATLGADGKVPSSQLPDIEIPDISNVTSANNGLMLSVDKVKLDAYAPSQIIIQGNSKALPTVVNGAILMVYEEQGV